MYEVPRNVPEDPGEGPIISTKESEHIRTILSEKWKQLVPAAYIPITKAHLLCPPGDCVDVALCTADGYLLEMANLHVVGGCNIGCCTSESITPFKIHLKYYIVKSADLLIIVAKTHQLQVIQRYTNVIKFKVTDFTMNGKAQLVIWNQEPVNNLVPDILVTSFGDEETIVNMEQEQDGSSSHLIVDALKLKINETENHIDVMSAFRNMLQSSMNFSTIPEMFKLIHMAGPALKPEEKLMNVMEVCQPVPLQAHQFWHRVHLEKYIMGLSLTNASKLCFTDVTLMLNWDTKESLQYEVEMFVCNNTQDDHSEGNCERTRVIPAGGVVYLIVLIDFPKFFQSCYVITGVITYLDNNTKGARLMLPAMQLKTVDVTKRTLEPFTLPTPTIADVLCVKTASQRVVLMVKCPFSSQSSVEQVCIDDMKFVAYPIFGCLYHKGGDYLSFAGIMLYIKAVSDSEYRFTIFARDYSQVLLLIRMFYRFLTVEPIMEAPKETPRTKAYDMATDLMAEMDLVGSLCSPDEQSMNADTINVSRDVFCAFRKQFSKLELESDRSRP